jgi:hypothetical protein
VGSAPLEAVDVRDARQRGDGGSEGIALEKWIDLDGAEARQTPGDTRRIGRQGCIERLTRVIGDDDIPVHGVALDALWAGRGRSRSRERRSRQDPAEERGQAKESVTGSSAHLGRRAAEKTAL